MTRLKMSRTIRKEKILAFAATCMELELILLREVSQKEKDKHRVRLPTCGT